MKRILFILLLTIPFIGFGQGWEKTYGKNNSNCYSGSVKETTDGGYIILGRYNEEFGTGNSGTWLIKTNSSGDSIWTKDYNGGGFGSVEQTNDSGYILLGGSDKLIKTDSLGSTIWVKNYSPGWSFNGWYLNNVTQTFDGGYIFTSKDYIMKTDNQGDSVWSRNTSPFFNRSIRQTNDSGFVIIGNNGDFLNDSSFLTKLDVNGTIEWEKIIPEVLFRDVYETYDSCYVIVGYISNVGCCLLKIDNQGDSLWTITYPYSFQSIYPTNDGGYIICGGTTNTNGDFDVLLIKVDDIGTQEWIKMYGGVQDEEGNSVQQTNDGGYIITGTSESFGSFDVFYIIKTDSLGNIISTFNIPTPYSNRKLEKVVDILGRETKPQPNTPFIEIYDDGSTEKKIVIE